MYDGNIIFNAKMKSRKRIWKRIYI
jgi:hypothetical protein